MPTRKPRQIDPNAAIKARIAALPTKSGGDPPNTIVATVDMRRSAAGIVIEAAKARRLSLPAYIRRAAYAFACFDLGLPLSDALTRDPRVTRDTGFPVEDVDGALFGPWEIAALVKEAPQRE